MEDIAGNIARKRPGDYAEAAAYIAELPKFTEKHTLEHTREFLRRLGDPALDRKIVHVAGTNGKGSVCAYIRAILEAEGKRTGFFTSPHLVKVNERIRIGRQPVSDEEFFRVFSEVYDVVRRMGEEGVSHPSYFEFLFGMGMTAFSHTDAEYIILETGLGGRLDATNAVPRPALTVITSISLDHTEILGDTVREIAAEKAGIIKPGVPVIFDGSGAEAAEVIRETAGRLGAPCREITKNAVKILKADRKHIAFSRANAYDKDIGWEVPMSGLYQAMNAELAICAAEELLAGEAVHRKLWRDAAASMRWPGRMEELRPGLIVDGAHNPGAVEAFAETLGAVGDEDGSLPVIVFSAVSDKKYEQMIACLCEKVPARAYIVTEIEDARRVPARELAEVFRAHTERRVLVREDVGEAVRSAYRERGGTGCIYCLGSLYLVGMIEKRLAGGGFDAEF